MCVDMSWWLCQQGEIQWCDDYMAQLVWPLRAHVMCVLTCLCVLCQQGEILWCDNHMAQLYVCVDVSLCPVSTG